MSEFDLVALLERDMEKGVSKNRQQVIDLRQKRLEPFTKPPTETAEKYFANPELKAAVNVALSLGRPLLLTGEPGCGKTLAASWIALRLGLKEGEHFHKFQVRSDLRARDLRYDFDAATWFRESQTKDGKPSKEPHLYPRALGLAFGWKTKTDLPHVVLIDEIDKAPRDFPNDLLLELAEMRFTIDETQNNVGPPAHRPIIVITSNAERRLPDPFLRRCIVHNIVLSRDTVLEILTRRLTEVDAGDTALVNAAVDLWTRLSELRDDLKRKPTIPEYWQWLALEAQSTNAAVIAAALKTRQLKSLRFAGTLLSDADLDTLAK